MNQRIEERTAQIGREMFERMRATEPTPFQAEWWEERAMQRFMENEWLKVQAFRLIDVLPAMNTSADIARHLREYFVHPDHVRNGRSAHGGNGAASRRSEQEAALAELGGDGDTFLRWVSRTMDIERPDSMRGRLLAWLARKASVAMAHRFIAGTNVDEAERAIRRMRSRQLGFTVDVLGEAAVSEVESEQYQQIYLDLITSLPQHARSWPTVPLIDRADGVDIPRVNVSVKLTSLYSQFDPIDADLTKVAVKERLRPILRRGMEAGAHVHIDMEHYHIKTATLEICKEIFEEDEFRDYPHFGVVLQAYLKDCEADARDVVDWARRRGAPVWVRLVKGAYWDTETIIAEQKHWPSPVWEQKWQSDACFERITRLLLENHEHTHVAFGSHNVRSLSYGLAIAEHLRAPGTAFELQMLYGMGDAIKRAAVDMQQRVRVYTPYGQLLPGMAYLIRRLLENTANESFLRNSVDADTPTEALLRDPEEIGRETPPHEPRPVIRFEFEEPIMDPFVNVPDTDFSIETNRQKMLTGLAHARAEMGREYPLVVGGERLRTEQWANSLNPARPAEVVGKVAQADAEQADQAAHVAYRAHLQWRQVPPQERAAYLFRAAEIMQRRRFELAGLEALECGKPWREADADVSESIDFCNYYGKEMIRMADNVRRRDVSGQTNEYYYAPRGVVAVISPWNFPLAILTGMTTAGLVTGNAVIMKPAEPATVIGAKLMEVFEEAGLPPGVLNYLPGRGSVIGEVLVKHSHVAMIAFTGSREVGCRINRVAAEHPTAQPALKKVMAEMGGKNATIVDADADLDEAVKGMVYAAFGYAGQKCSASSRCIVLDDVYDRFVERLVEAARSIQVGPAEDPGTFVPSVIDAKACKAIREYIEIGKSEAKCALEVDTSELIEQTGGGYYIGPVIFTDVAPDARVAQEEIFGPVLSTIRAANMDEAIEIFNGTDFALTGGIFSRSPANIARARRECECGNFYINRHITGALVDLQPFGGFKMSGIGSKAGGPDYLVQFCEPRSVTENTMRRGFAPTEEVAEALG